MQQYCPLHPKVVEAMLPLLDRQPEEEPVFKQLPFQQWLRRNGTRLLHSNVRIVNGDPRKFAEQHGDVIEWLNRIGHTSSPMTFHAFLEAIIEIHCQRM